MSAPEVREALAALDEAQRASAKDARQRRLAENRREAERWREDAAEMLAIADRLDPPSSPPITPDGSGSVPPLNGPDPSPTLPVFGVIVTLGEDMPAGSQLWVRRESWGELAVDERMTRGASWSPGQFSGLTVEVAP